MDSTWFQPQELSAVWLSIKVSLCAVAVSLIPGVATAWILARREFPGKLVVESIVHLPLILPPVVTGYILLITFGSNGWLGKWTHDIIRLAFDWKGAALASAIMGFPLLVRSVRLAFELVDQKLENAASTLGAGPWRIFKTITLPLALPGVYTGMILSFARSLGEFGATITFVSNVAGSTRTLPLAIYNFLQIPGQEAAATKLVIVSILISFIALIVSEVIARRHSLRISSTPDN